MKAAYIVETGPAEKIIYGDLPDPVPTGSQVLVKVGAVSINPIDTYIRNGAPYWELPKPYILGSDLAGQVVALGPDAKRFKVGERVWGSNQGLMGRQGVFSELAAIDEAWLYHTPNEVSDEAVAASALVGITAHLGLFNHAQIQPGETLFVHGGTGGVGSMVVQMAKIAGARVITTGGCDERCAKAKALGADVAINYKTQNVAEEVKRAAPNGVNVFWETLREPNFDEIVAMLAERGRIVLMAGRDARPAFPVGPFYVKGCTLTGFVMFKASPIEQRHAADEIGRWLAAGKLKAQIGTVLPLSQAAAAHKLQEENTLHKAGSNAGKIVLKV
ncbi:MAG TPA: NADPH:quinone reductase [Pirellulaceae bacterium]|nr:NADPH:quinone reductase [Pirellulaceae bacterium]